MIRFKTSITRRGRRQIGPRSAPSTKLTVSRAIPMPPLCRRLGNPKLPRPRSAFSSRQASKNPNRRRVLQRPRHLAWGNVRQVSAPPFFRSINKRLRGRSRFGASVGAGIRMPEKRGPNHEPASGIGAHRASWRVQASWSRPKLAGGGRTGSGIGTNDRDILSLACGPSRSIQSDPGCPSSSKAGRMF